jgi:hypothetical protein
MNPEDEHRNGEAWEYLASAAVDGMPSDQSSAPGRGVGGHCRGGGVYPGERQPGPRRALGLIGAASRDRRWRRDGRACPRRASGALESLSGQVLHAGVLR